MGLKRVPETNSFGLALPPSPEDLEYLRFFQRLWKKPDNIEQHHLYWPWSLYEVSSLARSFREHHFNSIFITANDHRGLNSFHEEFDGVPVPSDDVMVTYFDEVKVLDELAAAVEAVELADASRREGRIIRMSTQMFKERQQERLSIVHSIVDRINRTEFEVTPVKLSQFVIAQYVDFAEGIPLSEAA
jgi:hypothetical protein